MVAGAASDRSFGSPKSASVAGWSRPIRLSSLGAGRWTGSALAVSAGGSAGAISTGDSASLGAGGTGGLRGGFGGCGVAASVSAGAARWASPGGPGAGEFSHATRAMQSTPTAVIARLRMPACSPSVNPGPAWCLVQARDGCNPAWLKHQEKSRLHNSVKAQEVSRQPRGFVPAQSMPWSGGLSKEGS
jgi:hypothetical protein